MNHNIPFLRAVLENPKYKSGAISTNFIPEEYPSGFKGVILTPEQLNELVATSAVVHFIRYQRQTTISGQVSFFGYKF